MAVGRDLVEHHALDRHGRRQHLGEVPRDRLALAVLVRGEIQLVRALQQFLEVGHHRLLRRRHHVERLEAVVHVDAEARPRLALVGGRDLVGAARQVADVADRRLDDEVGPQHAADGARLGRRLHDDECLTHGTPRGAAIGWGEGWAWSRQSAGTPPRLSRAGGTTRASRGAVRYAPEQVNRPTRRLPPPASNRPCPRRPSPRTPAWRRRGRRAGSPGTRRRWPGGRRCGAAAR